MWLWTYAICLQQALCESTGGSNVRGKKFIITHVGFLIDLLSLKIYSSLYRKEGKKFKREREDTGSTNAGT